MTTITVTDKQSLSFKFAPQMPDQSQDINASGSSNIEISATDGGSYPGTINLNLAPNAQVTASYNALSSNTLNVSGDTTTTFIDNSVNNLNVAHVLIQPDVVGTGTFNLDSDASLELARAVAVGITVNLNGIVSKAAVLQVDRPDAFKGAVNFADAEVILSGLSQATDYDLINGVLSIYGGPNDQLIDTLRLTDISPDKTGLALRVVQGSVQIAEQGTALAGSSSFLGGTSLTQHASPSSPITVSDAKTGQTVADAITQPYAGPVQGLVSQFISITPESLVITANAPGLFIHTGSGDDAIALYGGTNVVDGGGGSNFLTAGTGADTFYVDTRNAAADVWSTVSKFHGGDAVTLWGISPGTLMQWSDGAGGSGFTGLTLHAAIPGGVTASLTLAGFSKADLASGKLSTSFGHDAASGSDYLYIRGA